MIYKIIRELAARTDAPAGAVAVAVAVAVVVALAVGDTLIIINQLHKNQFGKSFFLVRPGMNSWVDIVTNERERDGLINYQ